MSDTPRLSRRELREMGKLQARPSDSSSLTETSEIRLRRPSRKELRELERAERERQAALVEQAEPTSTPVESTAGEGGEISSERSAEESAFGEAKQESVGVSGDPDTPSPVISSAAGTVSDGDESRTSDGDDSTENSDLGGVSSDSTFDGSPVDVQTGELEQTVAFTPASDVSTLPESAMASEQGATAEAAAPERKSVFDLFADQDSNESGDGDASDSGELDDKEAMLSAPLPSEDNDVAEAEDNPSAAAEAHAVADSGESHDATEKSEPHSDDDLSEDEEDTDEDEIPLRERFLAMTSKEDRSGVRESDGAAEAASPATASSDVDTAKSEASAEEEASLSATAKADTETIANAVDADEESEVEAPWRMWLNWLIAVLIAALIGYLGGSWINANILSAHGVESAVTTTVQLL
ncbi:hypothetical protein [Trueperella sp. LYQ143]|uniref:hypothetical protein n=1 Tax=unclassified Trueperella TaxID=2630174 RepID=UPI003983591A